MRFKHAVTEFALGATLLGSPAVAQNAPPTPAAPQDAMPTRDPFGTMPYSFALGGCTSSGGSLKNALRFEVSGFDLQRKFGFSYADDMDGLVTTFTAPIVQMVVNDAWQSALKSPDAAIVADPKTSPAELFAANERLYNTLWAGMEQAAGRISEATSLDTQLSFETVSLGPDSSVCSALPNGSISYPTTFHSCTANGVALDGLVDVEVNASDASAKWPGLTPDAVRGQIDELLLPIKQSLQDRFTYITQDAKERGLAQDAKTTESQKSAIRDALSRRLKDDANFLFQDLEAAGLHVRAGDKTKASIANENTGCFAVRKLIKPQH